MWLSASLLFSNKLHFNLVFLFYFSMHDEKLLIHKYDFVLFFGTQKVLAMI